ncbi:serine hydrolase [Streptomyces orinoci]|uniref:Serine hydrolase n=1 Tax=Streptomyces orinoci TaxID=67339 RepID=A0ABV3K1Z0_STRON|nr:serine hydrolase [Streptomyces orinoci]
MALAAGTLMAAAIPPAAAATPRVVCSSAKPGLAAKLVKDIEAALRGRSSVTALALHDPATGTSCTLRENQRFDSASVVKVTVLATLLWDADQRHRTLTREETRWARKMITESDNASTTALWKRLGVARVRAFVRAAGMTHTVPGANGYWGLTQITARDQQRLLALLTADNAVLKASSRAYVLDLMSEVIPAQRWGTPTGAPGDAKVHVKNGWLQRSASKDWRVHSIGAFTGGGHNYTISVLTEHNRTMNTGVSTINAVARAVHRNLNPDARPPMTVAPPTDPAEVMPPVPGW